MAVIEHVGNGFGWRKRVHTRLRLLAELGRCGGEEKRGERGGALDVET